jgi:hypothetical protein
LDKALISLQTSIFRSKILAIVTYNHSKSTRTVYFIKNDKVEVISSDDSSHNKQIHQGVFKFSYENLVKIEADNGFKCNYKTKLKWKNHINSPKDHYNERIEKSYDHD